MRDAPDFDHKPPSHRLGQYRAWRLPQRRASPFDMVWISRAGARDPARHRLLPHGEPSLAIRRRRDGAGAVADIALVICGPYRAAGHYAPEPGEELIALRLKPETAASVFGVAPRDYFGEGCAQAHRMLIDACRHSLNAAETQAAEDVARALIADINRHAEGRPIAPTPEAAAADLLRKLKGRAAAPALAEHLGVSERQLRRRFCDRLGYTPKDYARQLRLSAAALDSQRDPAPSWAAIAAKVGFADQAHMIREFRRLAGVTPAALHRERRALSEKSNTTPTA